MCEAVFYSMKTHYLYLLLALRLFNLKQKRLLIIELDKDKVFALIDWTIMPHPYFIAVYS